MPHPPQEAQDIFGDVNELLEMYESRKAAGAAARCESQPYNLALSLRQNSTLTLLIQMADTCSWLAKVATHISVTFHGSLLCLPVRSCAAELQPASEIWRANAHYRCSESGPVALCQEPCR